MNNITLFGERVLVCKARPKSGTILVPETADQNQMHKLGRVTVVGTGKRPGQPDKAMLVAVDDLVYFQVNALMATYNCYDVDGDLWMNLHQRDLIARLSSADLTLETFTPLGNWCLVKPYVVQPGVILLPDTAIKDPSIIKWKLLKKGSECTLPATDGQEVLLNMGRCNLIVIDQTEYGYIVEDEITGMVEGSAKNNDLS